MAEREETITVAVRLPASQVVELRKQLELAHWTMSEGLRHIVANWLKAHNNMGVWYVGE